MPGVEKRGTRKWVTFRKQLRKLRDYYKCYLLIYYFTLNNTLIYERPDKLNTVNLAARANEPTLVAHSLAAAWLAQFVEAPG